MLQLDELKNRINNAHYQSINDLEQHLGLFEYYMLNKIYQTYLTSHSRQSADEFNQKCVRLRELIDKLYHYYELNVLPKLERLNLSDCIQVLNYTIYLIDMIHDQIDNIIQFQSQIPVDVNNGDLIDVDSQIGMFMDELRDELQINPV